MSQTTNAGIVTAYGSAVRGGYEGTYDQFCADLAQLATVLAQLTNMSAVAETLAAGSSATASYADGVLTLGIPRGDTGNGIQSISLISTVGLVKTYRITFTDEDHFDFEVKDGNGIASATLNQDYTLTLTFNDGTTWTSTSIRGATGATPNLTIGTVSTAAPGSSAAAEITGTPEDPVLNLTIPQGDPGEVPAAAIASTQASTTASKKILEGEYFWLSGILYIATAEIASGGTIVTSGSGANCKLAKIADDVSNLKTALSYDEYLINDGAYTVKTTDLESGQWSYSGKEANDKRARTKYLIPVRKGMVIAYENTTFDTYFGVLETPTSGSYIQTIGWKTNGSGTVNITKDGYLTFVIRNHADTSATVNPADYDSTVVIKTAPVVQSMIAEVENGTVARRNYAIGERFIFNNQFCKAKTAIAAGEAFDISVNGNSEVITVDDELDALETRMINGKPLTSDIVLDSGDIGYNASSTYPSGSAGSKIGELANTVDNLFLKNVFNYASITPVRFFVNALGNWGYALDPSPARSYSLGMPANATKLKVTGNNANGSVFTWLRSYNPAYSDPVDFSTGYNGRITLEAGETREFAIIGDMKYFYALLTADDGTDKTPIIEFEYNTTKTDLLFDEYFINSGQYAINASDLESGQWSYSKKEANDKRARTKYLIPVRSGMSISYENTTFDVYFNILETPVSTDYLSNIGWKTNGSGTVNITRDGYLTFIIRNHSDPDALVDPAEYNSTVVIKTAPVVQSMIAEVENGTVARRNYAIGERFIFNNQFCKARTAIAAGEAFDISVSGNSEVITVDDELDGLTGEVDSLETRTINGKPLSSDITLDSGDIGYGGSSAYPYGSAGAEITGLTKALDNLFLKKAFDYASVTPVRFFVNAIGNWGYAGDASQSRSYTIRMPNNTIKVKVTGHQTNGSSIAWLRSYNPAYSDPVDFSTGYNGRITLEAGETREFAIIGDMKYFYALLTADDGTDKTPIIEFEYNTTKTDLLFDEYFINSGQYAINASDLESGQWSYSGKEANDKRARTKYLIPVHRGMSISYENTTFDTYFNILETPVSTDYLSNIGWKTDGSGTINITRDGYLTFIIRNHSDNTAIVDPSEYDSTVVIETDIRKTLKNIMAMLATL